MIKYNTIANILSGMSIDPFDNPDTKIFINDDDLNPYSRLWKSYFEKNHVEFLNILTNSSKLENDKFGSIFIPLLKKAIIQEFIVKIAKVYKSLSLEYLAGELSMKKESIVHILTEMINNKLIFGLIDNIEGIFDNHEFTVDKGMREQIGKLHKILDNVEKMF